MHEAKYYPRDLLYIINYKQIVYLCIIDALQVHILMNEPLLYSVFHFGSEDSRKDHKIASSYDLTIKPQ